MIELLIGVRYFILLGSFLSSTSAILQFVMFIFGSTTLTLIAFLCTVQNGNGRIRLDVHRVSRRNCAHLLGVHENY